ncbi:MAG: hypothetical protein M3498_05380 [Deinococcota bacterium]|jgi:hypothetical protein|nr:hypothetical protein [Deinococcota bacterium]
MPSSALDPTLLAFKRKSYLIDFFHNFFHNKVVAAYDDPWSKASAERKFVSELVEVRS